MAMTRKPRPTATVSTNTDNGGVPVAGYERGGHSPKTRTIKSKKKGQKDITFRAGGLQASTGTPKGQKIPAGKIAKALSGSLGPKAQRQANFAKNVLNKGE